MKPRVWTARRKWLGNLVPLLLYLPIMAAGVWLMWRQQNLLGTGLWVVLASLVLGWLAINQFGLFDNPRMKREMMRELLAQRPDENAERYFVGVGTPKSRGMLDPHEDVGFLLLHPDRLEFFGDHSRHEISKSGIERIRFLPNIHSSLGLGRWIGIEAQAEGRRVRLMVEPRERRTLLSNRRLGGQLRRRLEAWRNENGPPG